MRSLTDPMRTVYGPHADFYGPNAELYGPDTDRLRSLYGFLPTQYRIHSQIQGFPEVPNQGRLNDLCALTCTLLRGVTHGELGPQAKT